MKLYYKIKHKILRRFNKQVEIPSYETKRIIIKGYKDKYNTKVFVETGTFLGDTIENLKHDFNKLVSIELATELAEKAKKRFLNDKNVEIIQGDSGEILKNLVNEITEPVLFWLDGHYSSEFFVGDEFIRTAKGEKDTPIVEELKTILSSKIDHIILVDDAREFNGIGDYPAIPYIKRMVKKAKNNFIVEVENDIIRIFPKI